MEDSAGIGFKVAALVTVTLVSLVGGFLPLRIHLVPEESRRGITQVLRFFTAGVFIGVGLLHMLPDAASDWAEVMGQGQGGGGGGGGGGGAGYRNHLTPSPAFLSLKSSPSSLQPPPSSSPLPSTSYPLLTSSASSSPPPPSPLSESLLVALSNFPVVYFLSALGFLSVWFIEQHVSAGGGAAAAAAEVGGGPELKKMVAVAAGAESRGGGSICIVHVQPVASYGPVSPSPLLSPAEIEPLLPSALPTSSLYQPLLDSSILRSATSLPPSASPFSLPLHPNRTVPGGLLTSSATSSSDAGGVTPLTQGPQPAAAAAGAPSPALGAAAAVVVIADAEGGKGRADGAIEAAAAAAAGAVAAAKIAHIAAAASTSGCDDSAVDMADGGCQHSDSHHSHHSHDAHDTHLQTQGSHRSSKDSRASFLPSPHAHIHYQSLRHSDCSTSHSRHSSSSSAAAPVAPAAAPAASSDASVASAAAAATAGCSSSSSSCLPASQSLSPCEVISHSHRSIEPCPSSAPDRPTTHSHSHSHPHSQSSHCQHPHSLTEPSHTLLSPDSSCQGEACPSAHHAHSHHHPHSHCPSHDACMPPPSSSSSLHGHTHAAHHHHVVLPSSGSLSVLLAALLSVHSFIVGAALGSASSRQAAVGIFIALVAHKWAEAFAVGVQFVRESVPVHKLVSVMLLYSAMTPLGILMGLAANVIAGPHVLLTAAMLQGFGSGTVMYVATLELLSKDTCSYSPLTQLLLVFAGVFLMAAVAVVM